MSINNILINNGLAPTHFISLLIDPANALKSIASVIITDAAIPEMATSIGFLMFGSMKTKFATQPPYPPFMGKATPKMAFLSASP